MSCPEAVAASALSAASTRRPVPLHPSRRQRSLVSAVGALLPEWRQLWALCGVCAFDVYFSASFAVCCCAHALACPPARTIFAMLGTALPTRLHPCFCAARARVLSPQSCRHIAEHSARMSIGAAAVKCAAFNLKQCYAEIRRAGTRSPARGNPP